MKTALKQTSLAVAIAAGMFATPLLHAAQPVPPVTQQREVGAFRSVELDGPYNVAIRAQGRHCRCCT